MGNQNSTEKVMDAMFELKYTSKMLVKQASRVGKEVEKEKLKVKKAIEKGNMDGARIYAQNAIRKESEGLSYLRQGARLDGVVARLNSQVMMQEVTLNMTSIVRSLDRAVSSKNLEKVTETMDKFESQVVSLDAQQEVVEKAMEGTTALTTPEEDVNSLLKQVADEHGLEVQLALPDAGATKVSEKTRLAKINLEEEIQRRIAEMNKA